MSSSTFAGRILVNVMAKYHLLFVYGTLKRGQPNAEQFGPENGVAKYFGQARTVQKWPLVIASQCNIPYLLDMEGSGNNVLGEIYEVDDEMLQHCDFFEGCPGYYQRTSIRVQLTEDSTGSRVKGDTEEVWVYILQDFKDHLLELPQYECYDSYGAHGLVYVSMYERLRNSTDHKAEVKKSEAQGVSLQ
ncbi:gamma-glutamylaminecyclotransferase C-like isoform X2 [Acanthaster planci]|uniref:Gamma-glutamylcyclotransferase family protein n=1 Tax=Acanthaster planci TaxID=133434 RepID=A0A8B7Y1R5_ACAPL|nr:gamma-glutamylaminecyclotransferase C-like isoform X2 [Acanthaster planci]